MNTGNPFGSQHSGAGNHFGGHQPGAGNSFGGQQSGASSAFGGQQSVAGSIFGSSQSGASSVFGGQQSGTSSTFGGPPSGSSNLFGLPQSGSNSTFGGQQSGASSTFGGSQSGTSNPFGASQSGASSAFGGQQQGANHAHGGQQFGFLPTTSSSSTGVFQAQQPFQFGQPSSFGQSSGSSGQPSSFGQSTPVTGSNPSFGQGASVPGPTSLFGHGAGVTGPTSSFGHGNETSGQISLFGQNSGSSGQAPLFAQNKRTSVFGQISESPAMTSTFGQGSGDAKQTTGFGQDSGAAGTTSSFGQSSGSPSKGTSFAQNLPVLRHSSLFGPASGGIGQTSGFRPNSGVLGQDSGGTEQAFLQSSGINQAASQPISVFGKPSTFGQPPGFTHLSPSGIKQVTPLTTATTATSSSTSVSDKGFGYKPSSMPTFSVPDGLGNTPGTSGGVSEFTFKPLESATFKPIFGASPEPEKSQAQITPESFTFSQPVSNTPAGITSISFTSQSANLSTNTGNNVNFSKPVPSGTQAPAFSFSLPSKKCEGETANPKASFASAGSSFVSFSSSSGLLPSGQAFQTRPSVKLEKEERDSSSEPPSVLVKGQKRKEDYSSFRTEHDTAEVPELTSKSDRPPEKRSLMLNRPGSKLFGRVLKDVLKSNEQIGRHWEVKHEKSVPEAKNLEQPATSQALRGLMQSVAAEQGTGQSGIKKGKRRDSAGKNAQRQLRRRSSSAGSVGELSPSELTAIQIKNIPDHLNKYGIIKKKFDPYGKVARIFCKPEKKLVTIHFQNHDAAEQAKQQEQGWFPDMHIFFVKKKSSPGKKQLSSAEMSEDMFQESIGKQSAEEQSYQTSPLRKSLIRSSVIASSLPTKGSPIMKSGNSKPLLFESDSLDSGSDGHSSDSAMSSLSVSLSQLSGTLVENAEERYRILDQRDRILRQARVKRTDLDRAHVFVGTCPDMCPEKERYMRETRNQLSIYEIIPGTDKVDHAAAVKEYSRSSADQEEPLPHELRPTPVLCMTMDYLITHIMDQGKDNYREWYDFVWNRTRAIRKDITQQHLCDPATVSLIEKCMRFHIHCAHHLCEESRSAFEAKINLENTTKCLQSLKEMYQDLANKGTHCSCEAEFRGYSVLLNLNKGDILREVQQFQPDVRNSPEVKFAVQAFAAFNSTNFVRFFRLVKSATYLSGCILHSYFNQIRRDALMALNVAYTSNQRSTSFPVETVMRMLLFRDCDEASDFLVSYGLSVSDGFVELNRISFTEPEGTLKTKKSVFIEQKRGVSIGEVVNGGPPPHVTPHVPVCSFNNQNKYVGDVLGNEQASSIPRVNVDAIGGQTEEKGLGPAVPLVKVHPQVLTDSLPAPQPLLSSMSPLPAGVPTFTPRQVLARSSMQPEPPSAFTLQPPLAPPSVQPQPPPSSVFLLHQPLARSTEPLKATDFAFQQPLVRPRTQPETSSVFTAQPTPVQAVTSDSPKASEFKFQHPHVRPSVQQKTPKASEFTFQTSLIRSEPPSAFPVQAPLVRPVAQPATSATSAFTAPQSVVRPTVHSESAAVSFTANQTVLPAVQPKPEFTDQHISEVVEELVEDSLKEHCKVLSEDGASYASAALSVSNTEVNELLITVTNEFLHGVAKEVIMVEKRHVEAERRRAEEEKRSAEEEKRKAEEARLKQERRHLIEQLSLELCSELADEVVKESTVQLSSSELNYAFDEDKRQRIARCSQLVSHELTGLFLDEEIFLTAKQALQELQCYCKYLQRWRLVVVARKKLRRQMRAFPAAPCCMDHKDKLKALLPSAASPPDRDLFAKGILQLGHAGNLGVSYTRLQWLKDQSMHQMKVQYFHQQLLCEAAWTPLDLPSLIAENLPSYCEHVFWKMVILLPDNEDNQDDGCSRLLSEWIKAKFMREEELPPQAADAENRIQTLTTYKAVGLRGEQPVRVHVCVKTAVGTLSNVELDQSEARKDLLGTSGLVLLLPAGDSSQDLAEEDVYWLSALLQLKQLLQAKPFHPVVPLVILVPSQEEPSLNRQDEIEEGLMLQDLIQANLISEYIIMQIPESVIDLRGSSQVSQAVKWLVSHTRSASELCCQTLLQFIEDGVCREFSVPFCHDQAQRHRAGLPSQEPSAIVELYNSVLSFLADVVSSDYLSELSWPVTEFSEPGGNAALPHLQWNAPEHLTWLKKAVLSFQIPHMDLPPLRAPWRPVCSMIFQYVSQIPSSLLTLPILESRVENLLSKTYARWKREEFTFSGEEGPSVQDIPWDNLFMLCIDHKLRDWKPPKLPIASDALTEDGQVGVYFFKDDLKKFVQPVSWEHARMNTLKEIEERGFESALLNQSRTLAVHRRTSESHSPIQHLSADTTPQCPHEVDITYVPSREELLPKKLSRSLQAEKEESQRFEDQLHRWLTEDPTVDSGVATFPLYIPQTIVSTPESIETLGRPPTKSQDYTASPKQGTGFVSEPFISLSERLEKLRNLIQSSREQDKACDLHLSTLIDVLDN
ncbi:germinal-center associated nuclear protein [Lissotriton helveticus]